MKKNNGHNTINLKMFSIDSEVSQYELNNKINEMDIDDWKLVQEKVYD